MTRIKFISDPDHQYRTIACTGCGHTITVPVSCGNRFCPTCSGPRRRRVQAKLKALCQLSHPSPGYRLRFLTLTTPNVSNLGTGADHLVTSFRRLRSSNFWRTRVTGGAYVMEVTGTAGRWHLHLHAIIESRYLPVYRLSKVWQRCSGGRIVYVKNVPVREMINYVTKYVTKSILPHDQQLIASKQLRNRRVFCPFGTWHNISLTIPKIDYCCPICGNTVWLPLDERVLNVYRRRSHPV